MTATPDQLAAADGVVGWLGLAGNFIGLLSLVLWALSVARDLQSGAIRVLLVNQARRVRYFGGKVLALSVTTAATVVASIVLGVAVAYAAAGPNDVSTSAWKLSYVMSAVLNTAGVAIGWGVLGAALAMVTRSSAAAIAGGIGYMLLGENLLSTVWSSANSWLPAGVFSAVIEGGTDRLGYLQAVLLSAVYATAAAIVATTVLQRRDISD